MLARIRGALGMAALWAAGWFAFGLVEGVVHVLRVRALGAPVAMALPLIPQIAVRAGMFGLVSGLLFAGVLLLRARHLGSVEALAPRRAALWGAAAGAILVLPLLGAPLSLGAAAGSVLPLLVTLGVGMAYGASIAGGSVALARRAPHSLPAGRADPLLPPIR